MSNPKFKILGTKYGITITKPWCTEMYDHNDKVAGQMKEAIFKALNIAFNKNDEDELRFVAKAICAYGHGDGYSLDDIHADACRQLDMVQNYWLNDWCWPELLEHKLVEPIDVDFVGYDKK